jgi:hypothetical protein
MSKARYAVELKKDVGAASFMAGTKSVDLTDESPVYEAADENEFRALLELPFLKEATAKAAAE